MSEFGIVGSKVPGVYRKFFNRPASLIGCQLWDIGERVEMPKICEGKTFFEPLLIYTSGRGVAVYYNEADSKQDPYAFVDYFNARQEKCIALVEEGEERFERLSRLFGERKSDLHEGVALLLAIRPTLVLASILANECEDRTLPVLMEHIRPFRERADKISYVADSYILERVRRNVEEAYRPHAELLTLEEALGGVLPAHDEIRRRRQGYLYFRGELSVQGASTFLRERGMTLEEEEGNPVERIIHGSPAWRGKVRGTVRLVFESVQAAEVEKGDILVTPMTTPEFLPAMKKAAAIVTDEGGITCHAAIVARELKKPCIIGTKIATRVLKNGDMVEVDAERGVVRVVERKS